jgi:hypothetical protein
MPASERVLDVRREGAAFELCVETLVEIVETGPRIRDIVVSLFKLPLALATKYAVAFTLR